MSATTTTETVVGVFVNQIDAEQAIQDLFDAGFGRENIGFVARNTGRMAIDTEAPATAGAMTGVAVGAIGGAAIGTGIAVGVIPVIGPILAIGALGTVLLNAAGGAAALGITGALAGWGIAEDEAKFYESEVQKGKFLVTVEASHRLSEAQAILRRQGAKARRE